MSLDPHATYNAADVARLVFGHGGKNPAIWLYRHFAELTRRESFPMPVSCIGRPRWSGALLIAWMNRPQEARQAARAIAGANVVDATKRLQERATQLLAKA